jgi:protein-arginine kinase activator protein McsA
MYQHARNLEFEEAAEVRDQIKKISGQSLFIQKSLALTALYI